MSNGKYLMPYFAVRLGELGIHTITCEECGETYTAFNSCRNRHCPNCQAYAKEKWIARTTKSLLKN